MIQTNMFDKLEIPRNVREARFLEFHKRYPIVYRLWDKFTLECLDKGMRKVGTALIMERIRWETNVVIQDHTDNNKKLKINDHHKPYYSRLWMKNNPQYKGVFEIRGVEGSND
jgi:hypothetical protein